MERCQGPILLISGQDDQLWPSAMMGNLVCQRLAAHQYPYRFDPHAYSGAGHMIGIPSLPATVTESRHPVSGQIDRLGGGPPDTAHASADAWPRMLRFLAEALKA